MPVRDAYLLGRHAAQVPDDASRNFLSSIMAANSEWPDLLRRKAEDAWDVAPWTLLAMAKGFATERANAVAGRYLESVKGKIKKQLTGDRE